MGDRASLHSALVSTQNRQHSRADLPSPHTGVGRKGRLLPTRRPFNFPRGQRSTASAGLYELGGFEQYLLMLRRVACQGVY